MQNLDTFSLSDNMQDLGTFSLSGNMQDLGTFIPSPFFWKSLETSFISFSDSFLFWCNFWKHWTRFGCCSTLPSLSLLSCTNINCTSNHHSLHLRKFWSGFILTVNFPFLPNLDDWFFSFEFCNDFFAYEYSYVCIYFNLRFL